MEGKRIESVGLYQDGTQIVINLSDYRLPNGCLISGESLVAEHEPVVFYTWSIAPGSADAIAKDAIKSTWWLGPLRLTAIAIRIVTSKGLRGRSSLLGICMLAGGMFASIVGTVITIAGCILRQ